jgi:hypothetical protein
LPRQRVNSRNLEVHSRNPARKSKTWALSSR